MVECSQIVAFNAMRATTKGQDDENEDYESEEKEPSRMGVLQYLGALKKKLRVLIRAQVEDSYTWMGTLLVRWP